MLFLFSSMCLDCVCLGMTGYYQESGRAGRDGDPADCILYFAYKDKYTHEKQIREGGGAAMQEHLNNLFSMVSYCMNEVDCRRTILLDHFDERFEAHRFISLFPLMRLFFCFLCPTGISFVTTYP